MATRNITEARQRWICEARMHLDVLNKKMSTILAISTAAKSMYSGDDQNCPQAHLFEHIADLSSDCSEYYALTDIAGELESLVGGRP